MTRYVAFLRGVNVGGNNVVTKAKLIKVFTAPGYRNVAVYRQSGNVIFDSDKPAKEITLEIQEKLKVAVGKEVGVFLRTFSELKEILENNPFPDETPENSSFMVTFLSAAPTTVPAVPLRIPKSTAEVLQIRGTEAFSMTHGGGEGALPNPFLEKTLKMQATTRNLSTIREIVEGYSDR
jgi:uncharacterized protein (DUF1697 family)